MHVGAHCNILFIPYIRISQNNMLNYIYIIADIYWIHLELVSHDRCFNIKANENII